MKSTLKILALAAAVALPSAAGATAWPANFEGVMLQGFYWDSYEETGWKQLEQNANEYSKYFKLIWVPNSAQSSGMPSMGYAPIYWFTHHNSSFGTEAQLRSMIKTYKEKGVGIIEDLVVNHRAGVSNWYNFPSETWNGTTYHLTTGSICSTDEVWNDGGHGCPTSYKGAPDTGDDFGGYRDLDHTNANVQNNVKNYCKFLIDDMGYAGFRIDMVKGYSGQYTKIYNQYSKPQFSVGEYFDYSYDAVAAWIEATGRESAAFDFPFKKQVNDAFGSSDMTKLCWKALGTTDQPAGMIHYGYQQYAVTFIDNHDTYRDGNKFNGNVAAANAFMLCSPGTPCVFFPHYKAYKKEIQTLIDIRNEVGVHNMSPVNVLRLSRDCYMAEVTGTKGKLVVKIGSAMVSPSGYSDSDIKASGKDYCVWVTKEGGFTPSIPTNDPFKVYFRNNKNWTTPYIHYWGNTESSWPGVAMTRVKDDVWSYTVPAGTTGCLFNAGNGDATKTADFVALPNHIYTTDGDQGIYSDVPAATYPPTLYLLGNINGFEWSTTKGVPADGIEGIYNWTDVTVDNVADSGLGYFSFTTALGSDWDAVNAHDRYGSATKDEPISEGVESTIVVFPANVSASGANSWKVAAGSYSLTANLKTNKLTISKVTGIADAVINDAELPAEYYNLQGVRVVEPSAPGIYIRVVGNTASKILVK